MLHRILQHLFQLVTGTEFLAMLVPHIQLRYECRIRTYGALSTTIRKRFGWIPSQRSRADTDTLQGAEPEADSTADQFSRARRKGWAHFIRKVWLEDPEKCPNCGETMKIVSALSSPEHDKPIKAILVSRSQWDPPWLRAPPRPNAAKQDKRDEPTIEYDIDPEQLDRMWADL